MINKVFILLFIFISCFYCCHKPSTDEVDIIKASCETINRSTEFYYKNFKYLYETSARKISPQVNVYLAIYPLKHEIMENVESDIAKKNTVMNKLEKVLLQVNIHKSNSLFTEFQNLYFQSIKSEEKKMLTLSKYLLIENIVMEELYLREPFFNKLFSPNKLKVNIEKVQDSFKIYFYALDTAIQTKFEIMDSNEKIIVEGKKNGVGYFSFDNRTVKHVEGVATIFNNQDTISLFFEKSLSSDELCQEINDGTK